MCLLVNLPFFGPINELVNIGINMNGIPHEIPHLTMVDMF